jgi:hypothetical protein
MSKTALLATSTAPEALRAYRQRHAGEDILVCGCGESAAALSRPPGMLTIGVNDIGRLFDPSYLVVVNPPRQFRGDRFAFVRNSRAQALFTQLELGAVSPPVVRFQLGHYGGTDLGDGDVLHYTQNSPYVAVCLAAHLGARRIGLIGVDFTDHHFFGPTGRHPLAPRLAAIDREYAALAQALAARGIDLVNLSPTSRLQSLPRERLAAFAPAAMPRPMAAQPTVRPAVQRQRVFVVNYHFVTCGDVFADGLRQAARDIGVDHAEAAWDDPQLPALVARFDPDLLLVVHGRRFVQRWGSRFQHRRSAVWLVDEPYEVDDTAAWSGHFGTVFVNDRATLARHRQAHYLPMCFDPQRYREPDRPVAPRRHAVGFIGGANPTRERLLLRLAEAGVLGYLVGGPWRHPLLRRLTLADKLPHEQTARLYQQTEIVINVFRDRHHFNRQAEPAQAMNPRIYEALACGALVVSERRAEVGEVFPALPQFDTPDEVLATVQRLLADRAELERLRADCRSRLVGHAYGDRLAQALAVSLATPTAHPQAAPALSVVPAVAPAAPPEDPLPQPAPRPTEPLALQPLRAMPRRHLLYHLWPVRGSTWRWNVAQLLQRIDLFNGRRIVAVVSDERCDDVAAVHAAFAGHGVEFVEMANSALGEAATFPGLLDRVAVEGPGDLSFYAHAKGVKYEPAFPPAVRRWAEVQYAAALDHWPAVREQLERFAMTGLLRRMGRFANHQRVGDWHYSGTFFWFRHDAVFGPRRRDVPPFYGGVEAWPGVMFSRHEAGCLLLDNLRELPYHERFWSQRGNPAFAQWQRAQRPVPVPPDLAQPPPFEGHGGPRLEQRADEFGWWLAQLLQGGARSLLVIGSPHGGVEWQVARASAAAGRPIAITTLQPGPAPALDSARADATARFGACWRRVDGHSGQPDITASLAGPVDAGFIDGEHGYAACRRDVDLALALGVRHLALHDIVDSDWHAAAHCAAGRVWAGLKPAYRTQECASGTWGGIGLLHRDG